MNICFAKVTPPWPHLLVDTVQRKHATWGEGETDSRGMADERGREHIRIPQRHKPINKHLAHSSDNSYWNLFQWSCLLPLPRRCVSAGVCLSVWFQNKLKSSESIWMNSSGNIDDGPGEAQEHHLGDVHLFHLADVLLVFFQHCSYFCHDAGQLYLSNTQCWTFLKCQKFLWYNSVKSNFYLDTNCGYVNLHKCEPLSKTQSQTLMRKRDTTASAAGCQFIGDILYFRLQD